MLYLDWFKIMLSLSFLKEHYNSKIQIKKEVQNGKNI